MIKIESNESDLIQAIADGDERAFEALYSLYFKKLHKFLLKVTHGKEDVASDILQESFLRVWLNRDKLREIENFEAWIYKLTNRQFQT